MKPKDFWMNKVDESLMEKYGMEEMFVSYLKELHPYSPEDLIHVREVDPAKDELFERMQMCIGELGQLLDVSFPRSSAVTVALIGAKELLSKVRKLDENRGPLHCEVRGGKCNCERCRFK